MKNGILRPDEGFHIVINGMDRSFRDLKKVAYDSALYHKQSHPGDLVEVRHYDTGDRYTISADGSARRSDIRIVK